MDLLLPLLGKRTAAHLDQPPVRPPPPPPGLVVTIIQPEPPLQRHHVHFYQDGNLDFKVQGVHFRVHQSILLKHSTSPLFRCMPLNPQLHAPISLKGSAETFALLLDLLYPDRSKGVSFVSDRRAIDVYLLARSHSITTAQRYCEKYLTKNLPTSKAGAVFQTGRSQRYRDDPTLAPAILKTGIQELVPWAVYYLAVQLTANLDIRASRYRQPPTMAVSGLDSRQLYQLFVVQRMNQNAYAGWNEAIEEFYATVCQNSTGRNKRCSRNARNVEMHHESPLFVSAQQMDGDAAKVLAELYRKFKEGSAHRNHEHTRGWCADCVGGLPGRLRGVLTDMGKHLSKCAVAFCGNADTGCF